MTQPTAEERIKTARALMLVKHPFFASLLLSMPMVISEDIPTAPGCPPTMATDMTTLYIAPSFVDTIDNKVLLFALAHEVMHVAYQHGIRLGGRNRLLWNIACDYAINLTLKRSGFTIWDQALLDEKYLLPDDRVMGADAIYNLLLKEAREQQKQGGQGGGGAGQPGGEHHSPMLGDLTDPEVAGDPVAEDKLRRRIQTKVAQAATVARMTGKMSGDIERFVKDVLEPKVPWYETLRHYMTEFDTTDEDWSRRNRRFHSIYLPTDNSECRLGEFIAIGDTSGSIGDEEMAGYIAEFRGVAEDCKPERIRLVWADSSVKGEQVFEHGDPLSPRPKGGGGTNMCVPLKHVEEYEPKIVVIFTDGYTPWPDYVPYPLIICCTTEQPVPPIGEVIRI